MAPVEFAERTWPAEMTALITGSGGEAGRCFYYATRTAEHRNPSPGTLAKLIGRDLAGQLSGARRETRELVRERVERQVLDAAALGLGEWRALDVFYSEQRMQRWGRSVMPRLAVPTMFGFATPEVARALVSMPLRDRRQDAFHRRVLAARSPGLGLSPIRQRHGRMPPLLRRRLGHVRRRLSKRAPSLLAAHWPGRPAFRAWVAEGVLEAPVMHELFGGAWTGRVRAGFLAGDAVAEGLALRAAGPVALAEALRELDHDARDGRVNPASTRGERRAGRSSRASSEA
jgi:hypothetical protein